MNIFIFYALVFLSLATKAFTTEIPSDLATRIAQMLPKEEWENFVPIVEDEQISMVNKVSKNTFNNVTSNDPELFSLKGYIFTQNPSFPVKLGDQFIISNEEKEMLPGGAYRVHLTLTSLMNGQSQNFDSHLHYIGNSNKIASSIELERKLETFSRCARWGSDWNGDDVCRESEDFLGLIISYDVMLEDGSKYHINYTLSQYGLTEEELLQISKEYHIEKGDDISFLDIPQADRSEIFTKITINGNEFWATGPKRTLEDYNQSNVFLVSNSIYWRFFEIENFGILHHANGYLTNGLVLFNTFFEPEKDPVNFRWKYSHSPMKMLGYFNSDRFNRRVFVFVDDSDNLIFCYPDPY